MEAWPQLFELPSGLSWLTSSEVLTVHGRLTLGSGAALALTPDPKAPPRIGSTVQVITARQVRGWFGTVTTIAAGIGAVPVQTAQGVAVHFVRG